MTNHEKEACDCTKRSSKLAFRYVVFSTITVYVHLGEYKRLFLSIRAQNGKIISDFSAEVSNIFQAVFLLLLH